MLVDNLVWFLKLISRAFSTIMAKIVAILNIHKLVRSDRQTVLMC